jgi:hypothetical protein
MWAPGLEPQWAADAHQGQAQVWLVPLPGLALLSAAGQEGSICLNAHGCVCLHPESSTSSLSGVGDLRGSKRMLGWEEASGLRQGFVPLGQTHVSLVTVTPCSRFLVCNLEVVFFSWHHPSPPAGDAPSYNRVKGGHFCQ